MDFGIISLSTIESYKDIAFAETKGFTHAWLADSQMVWADVYQCLALCAIKTTTIKLGTNVTNPSSRIAPVTACKTAHPCGGVSRATEWRDRALSRG